MNKSFALVRRAGIALLLCALLLAALPAALAEGDGEPSGMDLVYSEINPIPEINRRVSPSIVYVISIQEDWDNYRKEKVEYEIGYGSGVLIDSRGYIVTNHHVIDGADMVEIELMDGRRLPVAEFFSDPDTDLAVLHVTENLDLDPVAMGDSDALEVGELAIAIGNPGSYDNVFKWTVTAGIISALDRSGMGQFSRRVTLIQTDAAINSGNSGGALLNRKGELIGIPTLKVASSWYYGSYEGLGFAIPINTARPIIDDLISYGMVKRPRMGVTVKNVSGPDEASVGHAPAGVMIEQVEKGGPADGAGLQKYDIITHIEGVRIRNYFTMTTELDKFFSGDTAVLTVCRFYDQATGQPLDEFQYIDVEVELKIID